MAIMHVSPSQIIKACIFIFNIWPFKIRACYRLKLRLWGKLLQTLLTHSYSIVRSTKPLLENLKSDLFNFMLIITKSTKKIGEEKTVFPCWTASKWLQGTESLLKWPVTQQPKINQRTSKASRDQILTRDFIFKKIYIILIIKGIYKECCDFLFSR